MKLYHGTSEVHLESILKKGLISRYLNGCKSNFEQHPSHTHCVYLGNCYAPYFAANAAKRSARWAIIEVDVPEKDLLPDEDFLEQAARREGLLGGMGHRTAMYKQHLHKYKHLALDSLEHLGTAASLKGVAPDQITRVALFDSKANFYIASMCADASITLINHKLMGEHHQHLTRWFFETDISAEMLASWFWGVYENNQRKRLHEMVTNRDSVHVQVFNATGSNAS